MRAKINRGKAGRSIDRLVKEYGFKYPYQYWMYILDTFIGGNKDQSIKLFNQMKGDYQKTMLLNLDSEGSSFKDFIIQNL